LMRLRFIPAAHPDHPLHKIDRPLTNRDLRAHRHLVVRDSGSQRATNVLTVETTQRWTVSHMVTSIEAARRGYGFSWYPEEKIREELAAGTLKPLVLREGGERFAELYLIFADRDFAGPGTLRLAEIIREAVAEACSRHAAAAPATSQAHKRTRARRRHATGRS
jgi:DNA-binding transcriptional LysR family regulator